MDWKPIKKSFTQWAVQPNLLDYEQTRAAFSWEAIQQELDGLPEGQGLNIAHEAVDRHANGPQRHLLALRCLGRDGNILDFTYADLKEQSNRFANVLRRLGWGKDDRVFVLAGRIPELYLAALGALKNTRVLVTIQRQYLGFNN
jgi:acetyl-CoA synthetase